ncbi:hypothetical protein [Pseudonocardia sp. GCM10023141]|uniref:hypothetical protein n=1 Tax=Pseudonocardia sp. GCM10023141 TaxID=3252653 RepID=UPI00360A98DF
MGALSQRSAKLVRPVAVVAATAVWVLSALVNNMSGWMFAGTATAGALLTVLAVALPMQAERQARDRAATAEQIGEDAAARMQLVIDDALEPLAWAVA